MKDERTDIVRVKLISFDVAFYCLIFLSPNDVINLLLGLMLDLHDIVRFFYAFF